jgi:hypothetical protein
MNAADDAITARAKELTEQAPPLTDEQRRQLRALLSGTTTAPGSTGTAAA